MPRLDMAGRVNEYLRRDHLDREEECKALVRRAVDIHLNDVQFPLVLPPNLRNPGRHDLTRQAIVAREVDHHRMR